MPIFIRSLVVLNEGCHSRNAFIVFICVAGFLLSFFRTLYGHIESIGMLICGTVLFIATFYLNGLFITKQGRAGACENSTAEGKTLGYLMQAPCCICRNWQAHSLKFNLVNSLSYRKMTIQRLKNLRLMT